MSNKLKELTQPFQLADNTVKAILTHRRQMLAESDPTYAYGPIVDLVGRAQDDWVQLQGTLTNALLGQITHHRARDMKDGSQERDYINYAQEIEQLYIEKRSSNSDTGDLDLFFDFFEEKVFELESTEETSMAYFVSQLAIRFLGSLRPVNYEQLEVRGNTAAVDMQVLTTKSDWYRNYDNEGLIREMEWIQTRTAALADTQRTNSFVTTRKHDLLRLGHFYSAVMALSGKTLR